MLYTKAKIDEETLVWLFGIEFGFVDCSINSLKDLEEAVDKCYTEQEIRDLTFNPAL